MGQHDLSDRDFFSQPLMIRGLLREIVGEHWVDRIDFDSGEPDNTSFAKYFGSREADIVWKFKRKDGSDEVFVYVLIEFQSRPDPTMPVRFMIYRPRLRYHLIDAVALPREELEALNSPVAALFLLEKSNDPLDVESGIQRLKQSLPSTETALRGTFEGWLQNVILQPTLERPPQRGLGGRKALLQALNARLNVQRVVALFQQEKGGHRTVQRLQLLARKRHRVDQMVPQPRPVDHEPNRHGGIRPRLELDEDVDKDLIASILALELPDDVRLAAPEVLGKGRIVRLTGVEIDAIHPMLAHDLAQETPDHQRLGEEVAVTEVVLSHDFSAGTLPWNLATQLPSPHHRQGLPLPCSQTERPALPRSRHYAMLTPTSFLHLASSACQGVCSSRPAPSALGRVFHDQGN